MRDLSLHMLDIVQNSVGAQSTLVTLSINLKEDGWMELTISDNGEGMDREMVDRVKNPFFTTRTTRSIGLGIPMLHENARRCGGGIELASTKGLGTSLRAMFNTNHIDCIPLGNMGQTMAALCLSYPTRCEFVFSYKSPNKQVVFSTKEVKAILQEVPINTPDVLLWIEQSINEELTTQK